MYAQLKADTRNIQHPANKLREQGWIPGVLYSKHMESLPLKIKNTDLTSFIQKDHAIFEIEVDKDVQLANIKEIQFHPISQKILHISFLALKKGEKAQFQVPVGIINQAMGAKEGGIVSQLINEVTIKCEPGLVPQSFTLDISKLPIGGHLTLRELSLPDNVELIHSLEETVVSCSPPKAETPAEQKTDETAAKEEKDEKQPDGEKSN